MAESPGMEGHRAGVNPDIDYERSDLPLRALTIAAIGTAIFLLASPFIMLLCFPGSLQDVDRRLHQPAPAPRLQLNAKADLKTYLDHEQALLGSYGWSDRSHGIAHIPITEAMQRLRAQGAEGFVTEPQATRADSAPAGTP